MLQAYRQHVAERAALGIPPLPLTAQQTAEVIELLKAPPAGEEQFLLDLITHRVPAGVDDAVLMQAESDEQMALMGAPHQVEAVRANLEKRAPNFRD